MVKSILPVDKVWDPPSLGSFGAPSKVDDRPSLTSSYGPASKVSARSAHTGLGKLLLGRFSWACARGARFSQAIIFRAFSPLKFGFREQFFVSFVAFRE